MLFLTPCETCNRHVLNTEAACPFCGAAVTSSMRARVPRVPTGRLGRAALMAFSASVATSACGGSDDNNDSRRDMAGAAPTSSSPGPGQSSGTADPAQPSAGMVGTLPPSPGNPAGTPAPMFEPEPLAVAEYGVAIVEPDVPPAGGSGGGSNLAGQGGELNTPAGTPSSTPVNPEPGIDPPIVEPEPQPAPEIVDAGAGVDPTLADAGASDAGSGPIPMLEPEPSVVAMYGVAIAEPEFAVDAD